MSEGSVAVAAPRGAWRVTGVVAKSRAMAVWLLLAALALSAIYPVVFLAMTAFRSEQDYYSNPAGLPSELTLGNVERAFSVAHMGTFALNSLLVVVPAVLAITVISCLAAYALVHFEFPFRAASLAVIIGLMALPPTAMLIPIFKLILEAGLVNQRLGLIVVYVALNLPFSIYLLASFMRSIPPELLNAAKVDGAGSLRTLWSVVLPLVRPGLLALVTLNFLFLWNEFLYSLVILQQEGSRTIMVGISNLQSNLERNTGLLSAGLLLSMIPPVLIFLFFQRDLARGLTGGAVK